MNNISAFFIKRFKFGPRVLVAHIPRGGGGSAMAGSCSVMQQCGAPIRRDRRCENAIARVVSTMPTAALHRKLNRSASDPLPITIELERNQVAQQAEIALFFKRWMETDIGS